MKRIFFSNNKPLNRRHFLRGTGAAALSLPLLDAMIPAFGCKLFADGLPVEAAPQRFLATCTTLGIHTPALFPEQEGKDYKLTTYLEAIQDHRDKFTVVSGLAHPEQQGNNGHASELTWLTSAQRPGLAGFKNTISIDQQIAEKIGIHTRYPFLALSTSGRSMSWNANGVEIPGETRPSYVFKALFTEGSEKEIAAELKSLQRGQSILDTVRGEAQKLNRSLGKQDQEKLDEYLTAVRELEFRFQQSADWTTKPKPKTEAKPPQDVTDNTDTIARQDLMYEMIALAFQTDSTRTITFQIGGLNSVPKIPGVSNDWHNLSHHGKDPEKIDELKIIERAEFESFNRFLTKLRNIEEQGRPLLDRTSILYGSNLGNASSHSPRNLPIIIAGGPYRHGAYVAHDADNNTPFANLLVTFAQQMGLEVDQFGSSTAAGIRGLETT